MFYIRISYLFYIKSYKLKLQLLLDIPNDRSNIYNIRVHTFVQSVLISLAIYTHTAKIPRKTNKFAYWQQVHEYSIMD